MTKDDIIKMAQEAFDKEFPEYAAELAMYDAGSPAVSALDTIVARRCNVCFLTWWDKKACIGFWSVYNSLHG